MPYNSFWPRGPICCGLCFTQTQDMGNVLPFHFSFAASIKELTKGSSSARTGLLPLLSKSFRCRFVAMLTASITAPIAAYFQQFLTYQRLLYRPLPCPLKAHKVQAETPKANTSLAFFARSDSGSSRRMVCPKVHFVAARQRKPAARGPSSLLNFSITVELL